MKLYKIIITFIASVVWGVILLFLSTASIDFFYILKLSFLYGVSCFFVWYIHRPYKYYLPSFYLFFMFSIIPLISIPGYYIFIKIYHTYKGTHLDVKYALDIWLQGTFFVMLGIFLTHIIRRVFLKFKKPVIGSKIYNSWNWEKFNFMLLLLSGISFLCSIGVILKLGYIPILKGNIERERFFYIYQAGEWIYKLSRLWLIVYFLAFIKLLRNIKIDKGFYRRRNLSVIFFLICSVFFDNIYGDRFHLFIMFFFSIIMLNKIIGRFRISYFVILFLAGILLSSFIFIIRGADPLVGKANIFERYTNR